MKIKQIIGSCVATSLLVLMVQTPTAFANNGSQLRKQINQIESQRQSTLNDLKNKQAALNENKNKQSGIMDQVQTLESQIQNSNDKIQVKQNSIQTTKQNIQTLKKNMAMLQNRIQKRKSLIAERARAAYVSGGSVSYVQLLLNANNFYDFVNRLFYVNKIAEQDHAILKQQITDKKNLQKDQEVLDKTLAQMNADLDTLKKMKASLDQQKAKEQTLLAQLKEKANYIQLAVTNKERQASLFKQQEDAHKKELLAWEKEQGIKFGSGIPQECHIFIAPAQSLQQTTGIPAAITLAQIILESDVGGQLSELATAGKNLFGIKGEGPAGTIYLTTHEYIGGEEVTITDGFKRYNSYYQSMVDHGKILEKSRYQYFLKHANSLKDYAYGIQNGGYSTDPAYAAKLLDIIQAYGLGQYDTGRF